MYFYIYLFLLATFLLNCLRTRCRADALLFPNVPVYIYPKQGHCTHNDIITLQVRKLMLVQTHYPIQILSIVPEILPFTFWVRIQFIISVIKTCLELNNL